MQVKKSIIAKHIHDYQIDKSIIKTHKPKAGDLALFRVIEIGKHKAIQSDNGKNKYIFPEDLILCTFGTRYASEQFEGYVPSEYKETFDILGQGGVVGELKSMHVKFNAIGTTTVELVGYAVDSNNVVINTIDTYEKNNPKIKTPVSCKHKLYLSLGASMDSGKTTTAGFFSRGAMFLDKKVGYIKLTGTVYTKDGRYVRDCGAKAAADFSHLGYPSTYLTPIDDIKSILYTLVDKLNKEDLDYVIVEIADGIFQHENQQLLSDTAFMSLFDGGVILSCGSSLAIKCGIDFLASKGITPIALSGVFTASPLLIKEVETFTEIPIFTLKTYMEKDKMEYILS